MAGLVMGNDARPVYLGLGFGHAATLEKSETGGVVTIRGPRGVAPIVLDISVTQDGATVRLRDSILYAPPASLVPSVRPPVDESTRSGAPSTVAATPLSIPVSPVATGPSLEPRLSLQQYASLRASCLSASLEKLVEVRARYGLDEGGDAAEADAWARKFAQDPKLFESYRHYFQLFRSTVSPGQGLASTLGSASSTPSSRPSSTPSRPSASPAVPTTQALARVLTLGQHATMAAELLHSPMEVVYAKYGLIEGEVRTHVLKVCEERLKDPQVLQTWKQLYTIALRNIEAGRK